MAVVAFPHLAAAEACGLMHDSVTLKMWLGALLIVCECVVCCVDAVYYLIVVAFVFRCMNSVARSNVKF